MDSSKPIINTRGLPMRLERFKDVCLEKRALKARIEKLIATRESLAVREVEQAESELERIKTKAVAIRSQMEESRLADVGDMVKSEEAFNPTLNRPLNPSRLSKTVDLGGGSPSLLDTSVVKDSTRNSTSFKSAESPVLSSSSDECSVVGSPDRTSFKLNRRSEGGTTSIPVVEDDGQRCDEHLVLEAQRYAELCEERRLLEAEIERELHDEEQMALMRVESAHSSLQEVRGKIVDIVHGLKRASGGDTVVAVPSPLSVDDTDGGARLEEDFPAVTIAQPSSVEAKAGPSSSVSDVSIHNKPLPSLHAPESLRRSHFARPTLPSPEENQTAGSQIVSLYKPRKKLHKRIFKQAERTRGVSPEDAAPLLPSVGGE